MVAMIPILIYLLVIIYQVFRGAIRGTRKSLCLFVNMMIAMGITTGVFLLLSNFLSSGMSSSLIGTIADFGYDVGTAKTAAEALSNVLIVIVQESFEVNITSLTANVAVVYANITVNLVLFIICQVFVYTLVKFFGYIGYAIFLRKRVKDVEYDKGKFRIGGGIVGAVRGLVIGFVIISQISTSYYIIAGGNFYTSKEYETTVKEDLFFGYDSYYKSLKTSRSTGLGVLFENIKINGEPVDYFLLDNVLTDSFKKYNEEEIDYNLRKDLGATIGIVTRLYETGVITYDGDIKFNPANLTEETMLTVFGNAADMQLVTEFLPNILLDLSTNNQDMLPITITAEMLNKINLSNDLNATANVLWTVMQLVDYKNLENFNLDNIDFFDLDPKLVDSLLSSISKVTLITELAIPLGIDMVLDSVEGLVLNLDGILWNEELQNLSGLYATFLELGFSKDMLDDYSTMLGIFEDPVKLQKLDGVIAQLFKGELFYNIGVTLLEKVMTDFAASGNELGGALEFDRENYSKQDLLGDIQILTSNFSNGYSLYEVITSGDFTPESIYSMDFEAVEKIFLGDSSGKKGIMDMTLLKNSDDSFYGVLLGMIPGYGDVISEIVVDDWKEEFKAVFGALKSLQRADLDIAALMEGNFTALQPIGDDETNDIILSIQESQIISTLFVEVLSTSGEGLDMLVIPDRIDWYGPGNELDCILRALFTIINNGMIDTFMGGDIGAMTSAFANMSDDNLNTLLNSNVLNATLTSLLSTFSGEQDILIIPANAYREEGLYIRNDEIIKLLNVIKVNDITDITKIDINTIKLFATKNISLMVDSLIMSRTIVNQLLQLDMISIPNALTINNDNWYGMNGELSVLLNTLGEVFGRDATVNSLGDFSLQMILDNSNLLFNSKILTLTVSDKLREVQELKVPVFSLETVLSSETIKSTELVNLLNAINELGITDFNDFNINNIFGNVDYATIFNSDIITLTLSQELFNASEFLIVPTSVIVDSHNGTSLDADQKYIDKSELTALFKGLVALGVNNLDDLDIESILTNSSNITRALDSVILHHTISGILFNTLVVVEEYNIDRTNTTAVINNERTLIVKEEIISLFNALSVLGLTSVEGIEGLDQSILNTLTTNKVNAIINSHVLSTKLSSIVISSLSAPALVLLADDIHEVTDYDGLTASIINSNTLNAYLSNLVQ